MTLLRDEGSTFDAPIEKVWALMHSGPHHRHRSMVNLSGTPTEDPNAFVLTWEAEVTGRRFPMVARMTVYPPLGFVMEYVEGPFAGSKEFHYYIPHGDQTGINVVGDYRSSVLSEELLQRAVLEALTAAFGEDVENLARMPDVRAPIEVAAATP